MKVQAVGANFRDVLNVLGLYPGDPGNPGLDCACIAASTATTARYPLGPGEYYNSYYYSAYGEIVPLSSYPLDLTP